MLYDVHYRTQAIAGRPLPPDLTHMTTFTDLDDGITYIVARGTREAHNAWINNVYDPARSRSYELFEV